MSKNQATTGTLKQTGLTLHLCQLFRKVIVITVFSFGLSFNSPRGQKLKDAFPSLLILRPFLLFGSRFGSVSAERKYQVSQKEWLINK